MGNFTGDSTGSFTSTLTRSTTGSTLTIVYTRHGDRATRTDVTAITNEDGQGDYTLDESRLDFGATAADTAHAVYTRMANGRHKALGTYTTAAGDTGTLTAILARTAAGSSRSELHVSATAGNTLIQREEHSGDGAAGVKILTLDPTGALTSSSLVRYEIAPVATPSPSVSPTPTPTPAATPTPTP